MTRTSPSGERHLSVIGGGRSSHALTVSHLRKTFGNKTVVDDVSFDIREGEILGLVGPNGAGKSTTIHMILGLVTPSSGEVRLLGMDLARDREAIMQRVNFTSPYVTFPGRLTVWENLDVYARLYGVPRAGERVAGLLEDFGIAHLRDSPTARLSSGEASRVGLCKAFLNEPRLLLLDEPAASLDPQAADMVKSTLLRRQHRHGTAILLTSHNMTDVEEMCSKVVALSNGKIIASGDPLSVTRDVLNEQRTAPSLHEVVVRLGLRGNNASA